MVDALVSNVIQQLSTIIEKEIEQKVRLVVGVENDIKKLSNTFTMIRAVLKDAEKKQITNESVQLWLLDLKDVAYDIDDVLDEWTTAILKSQLELQLHDEHANRSISQTKKVCSLSNLFSPCCFSFKKQIGLRHDIGCRIKEINERLGQIASNQNIFGFIKNDQTSELMRRIPETSSLVDVREVFGRDMDRDAIIGKLLSDGSSQQKERRIPMIISIVGMPGLGKTTLAQHIFNDNRVKNHFDKRMWVHVSKPFDFKKVAMNIIREIGGNIDTQGQGGGHDIAWEAVHRQLTSSINGKQFLLVLDDVWNEDPVLWDPLRLSLQCGSQGSRIIVTTRNEQVAIMMDTTDVHRLRVLSDQDCWSILERYAFVGRQKEECEKLEEIGMELAKKCNGLPLFAKTLGSLLCFKQDWQYVLSSDVWRVVSSVDNPILPALLLSYHDLPSHLKQCFAYCSLIPRGYYIIKYYAIREWLAQGFLSDNLVVNKDEDLIAVVDEYFHNLALRSFLEKDVKKSSGNYQYYKMHDLVHDFAKSLVENECFTLTIKDTKTQEFDFNRARHLYLLVEEMAALPFFICKAKNVRTLKIFGQIPSISPELFHQLKCLRTLDLNGACLEELPDEIEKLIHLRWLNLADAKFRELPKTFTNLYNLKVLYLYGCINLCKLPGGIERLVNLIDLDLTKCCQLSYIPEGIGKLTKLHGLSDFIIGGVKRGGCKIGELKNLNFLKGSLKIIGLERVENGDEAKMACLKSKQHLRALYFYFSKYTGVSRFDDVLIDKEGEGQEKEEEEEEEIIINGEAAPEEVDDESKTTEEEMLSKRMEDVLENLQPNSNLEKLVIKEYSGAMFPNWMANPEDFMIFSKLVFLELDGFKKCEKLPSTLGKLPSLETLVLQDMDMVKFINVEFFAIASARRSAGEVDTLFPKLKALLLGWMLNLEEWDMSVQEENGKEFISMPCLEYLALMNLPKLRSFPQHLTQAASLRKLMIWHCPMLSWRPSPSFHLPFPLVEELILKKDAGSFSRSLLVPNSHLILPKLKLLRVRQSPYSSLPQGFEKLTSLEILDIRTCSKIKSIPKWELQYLTALKELRIMRCPALRQRCQKEIGENWSKISHIPNIFIDGEKIK